MCACMKRKRGRKGGRKGERRRVHKYRKTLVAEFNAGIFFQLFCNVWIYASESWGRWSQMWPLDCLDQESEGGGTSNPMSFQHSMQSDRHNHICTCAHFSRKTVPNFHLIFKVVYNPQKGIEITTLNWRKYMTSRKIPRLSNSLVK